MKKVDHSLTVKPVNRVNI